MRTHSLTLQVKRLLGGKKAGMDAAPYTSSSLYIFWGINNQEDNFDLPSVPAANKPVLFEFFCLQSH